MKTLYLDCGMGAAGDMLTAALVELLPNPDAFIEKLNALAIPGVQIKKEKAVKCGITGTHIAVTIHGMEESEEMHDHTHEHDHHHDHHDHDHDHTHYHHHDHAHHHSSMHEIEHIISDLHLPQKVQDDVLAVYGLIAEAESQAHGVPVTDIHFHEVGTMDAVADITAVCLLMNELAPDEVVVSPVHVGSGHVKCAHGILPVPAPATAYILKDIPIYGGGIQGELCTPTGAALLKHFATRFGDMPMMKTQAIGYGMGKKDLQTANCIRAMFGDTTDKTDVVLELSCNVDDMTAEAIGFAMDRLFEDGALEVYTVPIGMKKSRPGTLIRVMCKEQDKEKVIGSLFKHTTTIGVRETVTHRHILDRKTETVQTPYGEVRRKVSSGYGISRSKYEYDDLARIAKEQNISLDDVKKRLGDLQ
ncbi:MAG: nickel pincer cofactor biosynthesis protein LarC [Oscillospiraceae bacterium]|nr:nickel pincer cofactor biosynthesis protein LarC [Oscillospiraceae bacterium]